jgi:hypothetical protein
MKCHWKVHLMLMRLQGQGRLCLVEAVHTIQLQSFAIGNGTGSPFFHGNIIRSRYGTRQKFL